MYNVFIRIIQTLPKPLGIGHLLTRHLRGRLARLQDPSGHARPEAYHDIHCACTDIDHKHADIGDCWSSIWIRGLSNLANYPALAVQHVT